jgi:hypothetical protein
MTDKLWFVRRLDLFEGLSEPDMERLATLMHDRECRIGEDVVVRPNGDRIYLVKKGRVSVLDGGGQRGDPRTWADLRDVGLLWD